MWGALLQMLLMAIPPYGFNTFVSLLFVSILLFIWIIERKVDTLKREKWVLYHKASQLTKLCREYTALQKDYFLDCYCMTCCNVHEKECLKAMRGCNEHAKLVEKLNEK